MFDFDPDDLAEEDIEDEIDLDPVDPEDIEETDEETDETIVEEAIIAGTIFGMGVEEGCADKDQKKQAGQKNERSPGAIPLVTPKGEEKKEKKEKTI